MENGILQKKSYYSLSEYDGAKQRIEQEIKAKDVPQFLCLKIYDDKLDLEFEYGTFTFDLVDYDEYSVEDIIESVDEFFEEKISGSYC